MSQYENFEVLITNQEYEALKKSDN